MTSLLYGLFSVFFTAAVSQSIDDVRWLPCRFRDEQVHIVEEIVLGKPMRVNETRYQLRDAVLQFGQPGDSPVHSEIITFLVTASKVDVRRHFKGGLDTLECELHRHRTGASPVRWPSMGAQERDNWFTCTLRHTEGLFVITYFLRHSPIAPNVVQPDFQQWVPVADRDTITTSAVMMVLTNTPSLEVGLMKEQSLNCEFAVDHKSAHLTVEWHLQRKGQRSKLFSYSSRTGQTEGSGVSVKAIARGDASLKIPLTRETSEGTYVCSVHVLPLSGGHDITLNIMEPPRVSLNVNSQVSLSEGELQRVDCEAAGFYPLDVHMEWLKESLTPGASRMPEVLKVVMFSNHRHNPDGTYTLTAYFLLKPTLRDSGYRYTCRVSHDALRMPIRKSFNLIVTEKDSYLWYLPLILSILGLGVFAFLWSRRRAVPKAPKGVYGRA
ncbi:tapasin-related protein-like [Sardina pilchardus]|uniref:tapasin-related protein-like n=1 Tax=Sardina pilchardus TaxID=27697 RepID=UPI002E1295BB